LTRFVIDSVSRDSDGRLVLPALWDENVIHQLPNNYKLANSILSSIQRKFASQPEKLIMYNDVIQKYLNDDILEVIDDLGSLKESNDISFIAHNAVYSENADTTKCRVVLLSNLCEKGTGNLSHNQVSVPGPDLNAKLFVTSTLYRFNKHLMIYDLEKAFLQLGLAPDDCNKLHILWFKDIASNDFRRVALRFKRVPFGLRFSPALLMIALYVILILDSTDDVDDMAMRKMMFNLAYMDNIAFSSSVEHMVHKAYERSHSIFDSYCFSLQKFATNCSSLQCELGEDNDSPDTKLFGMYWDTREDTFRNRSPLLDVQAKTKRQVLSSLNSNFDPLGITLPIFNRAKLFLHELQSDPALDWDVALSQDRLKTWVKICKQVNRSQTLSIPRYIGDYDGTYDILTFTDSSKDFFGCVLYLKCVQTGRISFLLAKNRTVPQQVLGRTIPVLELCAVDFGVETTVELYTELTNAFCPLKIENIHIYTDSTISLSWLSSKALKLGKIERKGSKVNNNLDRIMERCNTHPMSFHHIDGKNNPADTVTRCVSASVLNRSNFLRGLTVPSEFSSFDLTIPVTEVVSSNTVSSVSVDTRSEPLIPLDKFSSFHKICRVYHYVRKFIHCLKCKVSATNNVPSPPALKYADSVRSVLIDSQLQSYPEVYNYLKYPKRSTMPTLVSQLNIFLDPHGVIRVKNKFQNLNAPFSAKYPVLLCKNSPITTCIVTDFHCQYKHAGVYKLLSMLRREFYITNAFVTIRKLLRKCVLCNKMYGRTVVLNQNDYKDYRINPSQVPYRDMVIDHAGPFRISSMHGSEKVYILILTCLFSRHVNLVFCPNIDNESFLLALQTHIFEYGIPARIVSDNGSPIVASINLIEQYLTNDANVKNFLTERGIDVLNFSPYPAGASELGGVVESLVKQVKNMIYSTISRNVIKINHFLFLMKEVNMLINKRPVALKSAVRDPSIDCDSFAITPEMVVRGYEVPSVAVIPHLNSELDPSDNFVPDCNPNDRKIFESFGTLRSVRDRLCEQYMGEFLQNLHEMGSNKKERYLSRNSTKLMVGDYVSIKKNFAKPYFYPTGVVTDVEENSIGEIVAVTIRKANGEKVRRHSSDVVLLMSSASSPDPQPVVEDHPIVERRPKLSRKAADECNRRNKSLLG